MRFRARKTFRLGPLFFNFALSDGRLRFASWGVEIGRFAHNFTRGTWSVDTPGPGSVHGGRRRRR